MNPFVKYIAIPGTALTAAVSIFLSAGVIGTNYNSVVLQHLEDVIQGNATSVVVSNNAPNWGLGTPLFTPTSTSVATSSYKDASSGLASSTVYSFAVAAIDGSGGTTTISNIQTIKTDAANTQPRPETINLAWDPVLGATGYAIFFGTTTATTASQLNQYFLATTTGTYNFATSSGSIAGSYTRNTSTAFSVLLSPTGQDYINGPSTATSSPTASSTALQVNGNFAAIAPATTTPCQTATAGTMFFNTSNGHLWLCVTAGPYTVIK